LTSTWTCAQCLPGRFTQSDGSDRDLSAGCQEGRMTPHGRAHCNDLKVRAPSSRAANPTMMVRGWPATSGEVTTTPWRGRVTSTALKKYHIRVAEIPSWHPEGTFHRLLRLSRSPRGWPALEDGAPKKNQAGPSTLDARSAWGTLRCPRLSKLAWIRRSGPP